MDYSTIKAQNLYVIPLTQAFEDINSEKKASTSDYDEQFQKPSEEKE